MSSMFYLTLHTEHPGDIPLRGRVRGPQPLEFFKPTLFYPMPGYKYREPDVVVTHAAVSARLIGTGVIETMLVVDLDPRIIVRPYDAPLIDLSYLDLPRMVQSQLKAFYTRRRTIETAQYQHVAFVEVKPSAPEPKSRFEAIAMEMEVRDREEKEQLSGVVSIEPRDGRR